MTAPPLSYAFAHRHGIACLALAETGAQLCTREGFDPQMLLEARRVLGRPLSYETRPARAFDALLSDLYGAAGLDASVGASVGDGVANGGDLSWLIDQVPAADDLLDASDTAPVIQLINRIIAEAVRSGASDVHIEPFAQSLKIRLRIDGVLREALALPPRIAPLLISRVKVMARLDIAERRKPQDGRMSLTLAGRALDVRVSTLPARGGERIVLRILDNDQAEIGLADLGMPAALMAQFEAAIAEPNGIILVTGPTGSGKTTSLYAALRLLNDGSRNILTVEDPVEYAVDGVGQTQVNAKVGMTFANGLRAILRQDPDVVMVGEIRDGETADIAVQAALTGHLVLSTLHTNDAAGAITRLRDLGVEPFLLASTVRMIIAQRLVRRLCPACRKPEPAGALGAALGIGETAPVYAAHGCSACNHTGYQGRIGVFEAIRITNPVRRLILAGSDEQALTSIALAADGDLAAQAARLVLSGQTPLREALRVVRQRSAADA